MKTKDFNHGKRLSAVLTALLLGCVLGMQAQTDYYVNVGGIEVTSDNCNLINSEPGATDIVQGNISYDPTSHTLTLEDAYIETHRRPSEWGPSGIWHVQQGETDRSELTVRLKGVNRIKTDYYGVYGLNRVTFVSGEEFSFNRPALYIESGSEESMPSSAILMHHTHSWPFTAEVVVQDCDVDIVGYGPALEGSDNVNDENKDATHVYLSVGWLGTLRMRTSSPMANQKILHNVTVLDYATRVYSPGDGDVFFRYVDSDNSCFYRYSGGGVFYPKEVRITGNISFDDTEFKRICLENWDTDANGELDYIEARMVTSLGEVFRRNQNIHHASQLVYFTGLEEIDPFAFENCSNLSALDLPFTVKTIGSCAFDNNTSLPLVTIPKRVETIDSYAFHHCVNMNTVFIEEESRLKTIGEYAFSLTPLQTFQLPSRLETIGEKAFFSNSFSRIDLPSSVTSIGKEAFVQSSPIVHVITVGGYTPATIGADAFGSTVQGSNGYLSPGIRILVRSGYENTYKTAWPQYKNYIGTRRTYGVSVAGVELAEDNLTTDGEFFYSNGMTAARGVYYDSSHNRMTLKDAYISYPSEKGYAIAGTTNIELEGNSTIKAGNVGICSDMSLYIQKSEYGYEPPKLTIEAGRYGIKLDNYNVGQNTLYLTDIHLDITTTEGPCIDGGDSQPFEDYENGIYIQVGDMASMEVEQSQIRLVAPQRNVIQNVSYVNLRSCRILYPTNMNYSGEMVQNTLTWIPVPVYDEMRIGSWIEFVDKEVERLCMGYDSNRDGGLDEWELAAVKGLTRQFMYNTSITQFPELKYFTGLTEISDNVFNGCTNLWWVTIPPNVTRIGVSAFENTGVYPSFNDKVVEIADRAFYGCNMQSVMIPFSVKTIGKEAFYGSLGFYFPRTDDPTMVPQLETIGERAFYGCELSMIENLPASLKEIGDEAFSGQGQRSGQIFVLGETPATIGQHVFGTLDQFSVIHVPEGTARTYKRKWAEYKDYIAGDDDPIATGIQQVTSDKPWQGVYSIDGRQVRQGNNTEGLPAGIYIVNGKKVNVR